MALATAALVLIAAPVHAGAQVAYVPVDGSPDSVLDPSSQNATGSTFTQDCSVFPSAVPEGAVGWEVVLPQADTQNPENVFDSVTLEFAAAGTVTITPGASAYATTVTPTDDVLLNGTADGSQSVTGPFPAFFTLVATCYTPPPPPPPPETTTTTTTTVAPVPPPTSPPGTGPAPTPSPPTAPPTKSQVLWSAAAVKLPFAGSLFALRPAVAVKPTVATTSMTPPDPAATPNADAGATATPARSPSPSRPLDRGKLAGNTKKINGSAASVEISSSGSSPWGSLLVGAIGASVLVFLIMAMTRRTDHRAWLRRKPRLG